MPLISRGEGRYKHFLEFLNWMPHCMSMSETYLKVPYILKISLIPLFAFGFVVLIITRFMEWNTQQLGLLKISICRHDWKTNFINWESRCIWFWHIFCVCLVQQTTSFTVAFCNYYLLFFIELLHSIHAVAKLWHPLPTSPNLTRGK